MLFLPEQERLPENQGEHIMDMDDERFIMTNEFDAETIALMNELGI